jgi:A/G-specific adenine glycosylase
VMADLLEFPYFEDTNTASSIAEAASTLCGEPLNTIKSLATVKHTFTRYSATLFPFIFHLTSRKNLPGYSWVSLNELKYKPFSSGHRKVLQQLEGIL